MSVKVEGGADIADALKALGNSRAITRAGRRALAEAAIPFVITAKSLVPVDKGLLRKSIKVAPAKARSKGADANQIAVHIGIDVDVDPPEIVRRKSGAGSYRDPGVSGVSVIQEFDQENGGNPFMRPAWDQHKESAAADVGEALGPAIEAEAVRLARRKGGRR